MYREDPIVSSSPPPPARGRSKSPNELPATYTTQPTQLLGAHSPFFALPSQTQPTLPLTPRANRYQPPTSQLQVPRSSPAAERYSSPVMSQSHSQSQRPFAYNMMAPPGTAFNAPQPVRKPVYDLTFSDPPVERDPDEDEYDYRSNIPVSKIELSSRTSRVEETPEKPVWDLSKFSYDTGSNINQRKRPSAGLNATTPPKRQKVVQRQGGPSRAMPVDLTVSDDEEFKTLEDILDPDLKRKTQRIQAIYMNRPIQQLYDALVMKKGHFDDACDFLAQQDSDDELSRSPQVGVARSNSAMGVKKTTAQRTLAAPVKNIMDKYNKPAQTPITPTSATSTEAAQPKARRRLVRGRRNRTPTPEASPARPQQQSHKRPHVIGSDDEDLDEGIVEISSDDEDAGHEPEVERTFGESNLLEFFNNCSVEDMVDLSGLKDEDIREIFNQRPFANLNAVRTIHVDAQQTQEKGKKKARKPRITFGTRLVEAADEMWDAYSTIDSVVKQCESLGKPMVAGMARWGIDIFGGDKEDGVDATTLDDVSDASSSRDSGYHTPRSDAGDSIRKAAGRRSTLLTQPKIMNKEVELKDYQVVGLNWLNLLWENKISGILADDMGLGKTCQVIAFLSHLKQQGPGKPTLIVVPGSTLENWCREFQKFSSTISFRAYYGPQAQRFEEQYDLLEQIEEGQVDVIITTYDLTHRNADNVFLRKCRPQICIFDEGHVLKNANTTRYKSLMRIKTPVRILLTGTPLQNSLQELMSILGFLMPDIFRDGEDGPVQSMLATLFKHKAKVIETDSHSSLLSAQRVQRARTMLTPFILRRKKAQVLKHLPKKTSRVEYCDLTPTQQTLYAQQLSKQREILQDRAAGILVKDHANVMMKLRQAAIHPLLFRHRYTDATIRDMATACLAEPTFAESNPDIIFEELQLYQDYQCHYLATKYPRALGSFALQNHEYMDSGKVTALLALLKKYQENGDRALVFSQFTSVMDILSWVFEHHSLPFIRLDGSTPIPARQSLIDTFHSDTSIPVFMISTKSGGAGINLAAANKVVIFDSSFNPQDDVQAENRAHRVGQTREVEVVRLVSRGTVEEQIFALGRKKLELDRLVQGEGDGEGEGKKKGKETVKDDGKMSKAEEAGMQAVEMMLMEELEGKGKDGDVKEMFRDGLKKAGVNVAD